MSQCATSVGQKEEKSEGQSDNFNKPSKRHILGSLFTILGVSFCVVGIFFSLRITKVTESFNVELGESLSRDLTDYFSGSPLAYKLAKLSTKELNENKVGEYTVYVKYLFKTIPYKVTVEDTVAPVATFSTDNFVCELDKDISGLYFIESIDDKSRVSASYINTYSDDSIKTDGDSVLFTEEGVHNLDLRLTDDFGNFSDYYLSVVVDTAPVISGEMDYYVALGSNINLLSSVSAFDEDDGYISDVSYTVSGDYLDYEGDYKITYTATDSLGLTGTAQGTLHAYDELVIQDMVNTGKLDPFASNVSGVINPYDSGYIVDGNCEEAVENIKPAVIRIHYETSRARTNGSGYIVSIDDENVIVCTNKHVVGSRDSVSVSLFDGTNVTGEVVAGQTAPDIAFVRIHSSNIPTETLKQLKTIHINLSYYKELSSQPEFEMGMYCINEDGSEWLTRYGKVVRKSGKLAEYFKNYDYEVTEVSVRLTPGVSGSAIVDAHGNLLCMAAFYWVHGNETEYYGVSLDDILDYYEEVFGKRLEYY